MNFLFHRWYRDMLVRRNIKWRLRLFLSRFRLFGCSRWVLSSCMLWRHVWKQLFFSKQWKYRCNTSFAVGGIWGLGLVISRHEAPGISTKHSLHLYVLFSNWILMGSVSQQYATIPSCLWIFCAGRCLSIECWLYILCPTSMSKGDSLILRSKYHTGSIM